MSRSYQMELLNVAIVLQALSLCQGLQKTITPSQKNVSQSEGMDEPVTNQTNAFTPQLSGNCSGTLGLLNHTEWTAVLLTSPSERRVANQICKHLGCMKAFSVNHTAVHNTTCLTNCTYSDFKLMNCTEVSQNTCTSVTEIVCRSSLSKAVRLVGGSNRCEGRVELWHAGKWGTACQDNWDLDDASVVCKQLGCGSAFRVTGEGGDFGVGSGPIFLDQVNCTGTEKNLWDCSALRTSNCTHKEHAGVVCSDSPAAQHTTTVAVTTGTWTTTFMTSEGPSWGPRLSPAEVGCTVLTLLLVMALVANAILCWRLRKKERAVPAAAEQSKQTLCTYAEQQENDYRGSDNPHKLHTGTTGHDVVLNPRVLCAQDSVGNFSIDSDYEPYDFSLEPAIALATFKNSLRNRGDNRSPTLKPSSLFCLTEEETDQASGLADDPALPGCHEHTGRFPTLGNNHISGISERKNQAVPSVDSLDSSSTSSGECYENTGRKAEQGDALPVEMTKGGEAFQPQMEKYVPEQEDSFDSSSTSSGECYENTGKEAERHIQEMTEKEPFIQPQNKHYNPGLTNCFPPDPHSQVDSFDSSSTSSGECYENTGREAELHTQGDGIPIEVEEREGQPQAENHDPGFTNSFFQPQNDGDSSSTSSGDDYDIPEGQGKPLFPAVKEDFDQSSSDSDYDDVANYIL